MAEPMLATLLAIAVGAGPAAAVRAHLDEADFRAAARALRTAEARADLTRADLVELLELRALLLLAVQKPAPMRRALSRLAALDYNRRFSPATNPDLINEYLRQRARLPGPLSVTVSRRETPTGPVLAVEVANGLDLVDVTTLDVRPVDEAAWQRVEGLRYPLSPGQGLEYRAQAKKGHVVLAEAKGRLTAPDADRGLGPWLWIGGAGVVVAAVVVAIVVAGQSGGEADTSAQGPQVAWP